MAQICTTIPKSTKDAIVAKASQEQRTDSQVASLILQAWEKEEARKQAKNKK